MSLQHANHHTRVLWSRTAHSQVFQSRVGPEAAGNSAIQTILVQVPGRQSAQSKGPQTHRKFNAVRDPMLLGMVPVS
jgi:hypothetical protein